MAQQVEHVLGKDEVTGSNPVSSSKKRQSIMDRRFLLFHYSLFTECATDSRARCILYSEKRNGEGTIPHNLRFLRGEGNKNGQPRSAVPTS